MVPRPRRCLSRRQTHTIVVDFRAYTLKVGSVAAFLELFQKEGLEPQQRILINFMGLYRTELGDVNQIIMIRL